MYKAFRKGLAKGVDETDQKFMKDAALGDEAEIQLGQMAQEKASNPRSKTSASA